MWVRPAKATLLAAGIGIVLGLAMDSPCLATLLFSHSPWAKAFCDYFDSGTVGWAWNALDLPSFWVTDILLRLAGSPSGLLYFLVPSIVIPIQWVLAALLTLPVLSGWAQWRDSKKARERGRHLSEELARRTKR